MAQTFTVWPKAANTTCPAADTDGLDMVAVPEMRLRGGPASRQVLVEIGSVKRFEASPKSAEQISRSPSHASGDQISSGKTSLAPV
jgi:hypothetical protein